MISDERDNSPGTLSPQPHIRWLMTKSLPRLTKDTEHISTSVQMQYGQDGNEQHISRTRMRTIRDGNGVKYCNEPSSIAQAQACPISCRDRHMLSKREAFPSSMLSINQLIVVHYSSMQQTTTRSIRKAGLNSNDHSLSSGHSGSGSHPWLKNIRAGFFISFSIEYWLPAGHR